MKKIGLFLFIVTLMCSCQMQKPTITAEKTRSEVMPPSPAQALDKPVIRDEIKPSPLFGDILKTVSVSRSSFNPSLRQSVTLSFVLAKPAKATVNIYDPDNGLVTTQTWPDYLEPGEHDWAWDGRNMNGLKVPDEAFFFTVLVQGRNGKKEIYDPTVFSGGVENDITEVTLNSLDHSINYTMPEMGRVMIRMGIQGGPLMNQLVDWEPRVKGAITEYWNGRDADNLVDIYNHPKFKMIVTYFTLPDNSVITFGNKSMGYLDYKQLTESETRIKPERESYVKARSSHYRLDRTTDYTPKITVDFKNVKGVNKEGLPILSEKTMLKVELAEKDKAVFLKHQFEICIFLDYMFYAEDETGFTPFNWVWDLSGVKEGDHVVTVNISSFQDQIGMISKKVHVIK